LSDLEIVDAEAIAEQNKATAVNNIEALEELASSLKKDFTNHLKGIKSNNWLEKLTVTANEGIDENLNVDDDIKRELVFYNLTLLNSKDGVAKLKQQNVKINRPEDFFAEMLKSDKQMEKIRRKIVDETTNIKKFEERKQKMQNVKFSKAIRDFKNKEKANFKKNTKEGLEKWKAHIKTNPDDYGQINKFFDNKKPGGRRQNIFSKMDRQGKGKFGPGRGGRNQGNFGRNQGDFGGNRGGFGGNRGGFGRNKGRFGRNQGDFEGNEGKFQGRNKGRFGRNQGDFKGNEGRSQGRNKGSGGGFRGKKMAQAKRPGKVARMNNRNKKNSFKSK